jgi:hypothetical protein
MQYAFNLTWFTRLSVTSHSQPLINAKYKVQVTNYLQTMFKTITNEPIWIIILITSWLTINIAPFHSRSDEDHYRADPVNAMILECLYCPLCVIPSVNVRRGELVSDSLFCQIIHKDQG